MDWRRVLTQNQPVKLAVNVAKMTDSIERVGLIISEKLKSPVRCNFGENTADFRSPAAPQLRRHYRLFPLRLHHRRGA